MRMLGLTGVLTAILGLTGPALAQSPFEGPLAAPNAAASAQEKPAQEKLAKEKSAKEATKTRSAHRKSKTAHHAGSHPVATSDDAPTTPKAIVHSDRGDPADPVSFGMKWSGSSDNARETRVQNYNGAASGSGGEVGFKFHF